MSCPPEVDNKILLQKTPQVLVPGHREVKRELNWKLSTCWLAFVVLEGDVYVGFMGKPLMMLSLKCHSASESVCYSIHWPRCADCCNSGRAGKGVTNSFLLRFEGGNSSLIQKTW